MLIAWQMRLATRSFLYPSRHDVCSATEDCAVFEWFLETTSIDVAGVVVASSLCLRLRTLSMKSSRVRASDMAAKASPIRFQDRKVRSLAWWSRSCDPLLATGLGNKRRNKGKSIMWESWLCCSFSWSKGIWWNGFLVYGYNNVKARGKPMEWSMSMGISTHLNFSYHRRSKLKKDSRWMNADPYAKRRTNNLGSGDRLWSPPDTWSSRELKSPNALFDINFCLSCPDDNVLIFFSGNHSWNNIKC